MTKFEVMFVVFLKTIAVAAFSKPADTAIFHQTNDTILDILDDLFIALKMGQNFSRSINVEEYMSKHNLIQDALYNNHVKYKEIHDISKTNISHKTAYYISNINEVVDEMIRTENVKKPSIVPNSNSTLDESQNFVNFTRFNLNIKTIATTTPKLPPTNGSQAEARRIFEDSDSSTLDTKDSQDEVRRIFEGSSTGIKKYPFMVSVHVAGQFVCAGSLVHESLAISAATCVMRATDMNADIRIRVASDYVSRMGYLVKIQETIFHPEFCRTTLANNLVILRTRKALRFRKQRLVAIEYDRAAVSALTRDVQDVVILGWGQRKTVGADLLEKDRPLSEAHVQLYNFRDCRYIYTRDFVGDKTFCAGFIDRGAGACNQHDAGGPALIANMLVGVISFGSPKCGATEAPTVFTRVGVYDTWIDSILQKLNQNPEMPLQQSRNISKNIVRTEIMNLDEELKEVYKENFVADEVLNGPIETLEDNEMPNLSHKLYLQKFPRYPREFPKQASLNIPKLKTLKSAELSDGYWRDYSIEETQKVDEYYRPAAKLGTTRTVASIGANQKVEKLYQIQAKNEIYKDNVKFAVKFTSSKEANLDGNYFDNKHNNIKINSKKKNVIGYALIIKESNKKGLETSTDSVYRENPDGNDNAQTKQIETENQQFQISQPTGDEIERTASNERAIIVLVDSGTTQRIDLHNNDPVYQRGFKILADRVRQAQALV